MEGTKRRRLLAWTIGPCCVLSALLIAGMTWPAQAVVITPGPAEDMSHEFSISGVPVSRLHGRYLMTSVYVEQPSVLGLLLARLRGRHVESASGPDTTGPAGWLAEGAADLEQSQRSAAAAAAGAAGLRPRVGGDGVYVLSAPVRSAVRPGDTIVQVGGRPVSTAAELASLVKSRPAGSSFDLLVERNGGREHALLRSSPGADSAGAPHLGLEVRTRSVTFELPFTITFRNAEDSLGPSAGLAYALAIADALSSEDLARGRVIAATGGIDATGDIEPMGGVDQKARGARAKGAELMLVPRGQGALAATPGLEVIEVSSLSEALSALRATDR